MRLYSCDLARRGRTPGDVLMGQGVYIDRDQNLQNAPCRGHGPAAETCNGGRDLSRGAALLVQKAVSWSR